MENRLTPQLISNLYSASQVHSDRLLPEDMDARRIAKEAFQDACQFTSVCLVATPCDEVRARVTAWWKEAGRKELLPAVGNNSGFELEDDLTDNEEVVEDSAAPNMAETHEKTVAMSLESVENQLEMEAELREILTKGPGDTPIPDETEDAGSEPETDQETTHEPEEKKVKNAEAETQPENPIRTLHDVLAASGFLDFKPTEKDRDRLLIERVRHMTGAMNKFGTYMRLSEKLLSPASIRGRTAKPRIQNLAEHALSMARAAHQCSGQRQSRFSLWANFSQRTLDKAKEEVPDKDAVAGIVKIGAPTTVVDGLIKHQLIVIKPVKASMAEVNSLRFATPTNVWRVARRTAKTGQRVFPSGELPMELLSRVHALLLTPKDVASKNVVLQGGRPSIFQYISNYFNIFHTSLSMFIIFHISSSYFICVF